MTIQSVAAVLINELGQVLLFARDRDPTNLGIPAGMVDPDEDPIDAVNRELWEESGLQGVSTPRPIYQAVSGGNLCQGYMIEHWRGEITDAGEEGYAFWGDPQLLLQDTCTYREFNRGWMEALGFVSR